MATADRDALVGLLREHRDFWGVDEGGQPGYTAAWHCACGAEVPADDHDGEEWHAAHLAAVIEAHYAERLADVIRDARAEGWDEGFRKAARTGGAICRNPYRASSPSESEA